MAADRNSAKFNDKNWVRDLFLVGKEDLDGIPIEMRTWSSADFKFQDTGLGGSLVINPLPQPNYFSDPLNPNSFMAGKGMDGLGPYFSETYDDNYRVVSFRAGTMAFNSLTGFLFGMYSPAGASLANKGRGADFMFIQAASQVLAGAVRLVALPFILVGLVGKAVNFFMRKPSGRYAYLKPAMPLYWTAVQTIVNHFMVNLGLLYPSVPLDVKGQPITAEGVDLPKPTSAVEYNHLTSLFPDIADALGLHQGGVQLDVFKIATRAQRLAHTRQEFFINELAISKASMNSLLNKIYTSRSGGREGMSLSGYIQNYLAAGPYKMLSGIPEQDKGAAGTDGKGAPADSADSPTSDEIADPSFKTLLESELRDGGAFVSFRVDDTGSVSESFSNNFKPSSLAEKINSAAASSRSTMFNLSGGNIGDNPVANLMESMVSGVKSILENTVEAIGLGGLAIMGGGGTLDMPKYWESSEAQQPKPGYSFTLTSRYANRRSALNDIFIPLACIMALALPLSTGKHSHSNPFYLEFYDKGRMQTRLGAIDSLSISRGDGTMGFTPDGHVMSITVNFSIVPMEETIAMPISETFNVESSMFKMIGGGLVGGLAGATGSGFLDVALGLAKDLFDDDTPFMDYLAVLSGLGLNEQIYLSDKLKRRLRTSVANIQSSFSVARMASFTADTMPGQIFAAFANKRTER
jgi:PHIKZ182